MSKNTLRLPKLTTRDPRPDGGTCCASHGALDDQDLWGQNFSTYLSSGEELEEFLLRHLMGVHILSIREPMVGGSIGDTPLETLKVACSKRQGGMKTSAHLGYEDFLPLLYK